MVEPAPGDFPACRELNRLVARLSGGVSADGSSTTPATEPLDTHLDELEERMIWIFGSGRSGSSWLLRLLQPHSQVAALDEPGIGEHLVQIRNASDPEKGYTLSHVNDTRSDDPNYFFCREYEDVWRPALRRLILTRFSHQLEQILFGRGLPPDLRVVVKEPNGSHAANLLTSLLPTCSLIFLIRDGRDVVDSALAAALGDSWGVVYGVKVSEEMRRDYLQRRANLWVHSISQVQRAYADAPPERRMLVRYEELLSSTLERVAEIMSHFELDVDEDQLRAHVAAEAFDAIPVEERGPSRPARAATPGLWRKNLTDDEQGMLEKIMGEKLRELGYS